MWKAQSNFGIDRDTSKFMLLVCFADLKFAPWPIPRAGELQIQHTRRMWRRLLAAAGLVAVLGGPAVAQPRIVSLDQCSDEYVLALASRSEIVGVSKRALNAASYLR